MNIDNIKEDKKEVKKKLNSMYGYFGGLHQQTIKYLTPDLKDFDKMVLFEFKIALDKLVDSDIVMIDKFKVKELLYESEMKVYKRLTTTHIEVK